MGWDGVDVYKINEKVTKSTGKPREENMTENVDTARSQRFSFPKLYEMGQPHPTS